MVVVGRLVWLKFVRLGGVVFRCPIGRSRGRRPWCRQAAGGLSASALWPCGFLVVSLSLLLSCVPAGWWVCVCGAGGGVWPIPICRLVGFFPFPVVLVFFLFLFRRGFCLFLPLPSLSMHWSVSGVVNWLAALVAGGRRPCSALCALWLMYTHRLVTRCVGPGLCSAGWAVAPAGFAGSWVRGGQGVGWVLLWAA